MIKLFKNSIEDINIQVNKENLGIFFTTLIAALITHFQLYALEITGPDTLINSIYHQADVWEAMLMRFGLDLIQMIKGNIVAPFLVTLISCILLGITVILIIDTLEIKNKCFKYIIAVIFAVAPNISATLTFFYCSDAYILGLLLATLAVYLIKEYKNVKWVIPASALMVAFAMGMYQTYLSVTMVLCVATMLIELLNRKDKKEIFIKLIKYVIMGVLGILFFYLLSHITLLLKNIPLSTYSGANTIGLSTLWNFPMLLPEAYQSFFNYFFNDNMIPNTIWHTNILYIIIFSLMLIAVIYIVIKNKVYENKINIILVIIFTIILPICFGIIEIIVPDVDIHILMACSMIFVFPIFFKILELLPKNMFSNILKYIIVFCSIWIIWNYIWQDNASYSAIKTMQNQAVSTVSRIVTQIEQLEEYTPQMPVLFLGGLKDNEYLNKNNTMIEAKKIYNRTWGFVSNDPTIWWGNLDSWQKILYEYAGVNMNLVSEWISTDIFETDEYKNMQCYPNRDSIKIINDTVVVKLST